MEGAGRRVEKNEKYRYKYDYKIKNENQNQIQIQLQIQIQITEVRAVFEGAGRKVVENE